MANLLTSDQFVTGVLCELLLQGVDRIELSDGIVDEKFRKIYDALVQREEDFDVELNFHLTTDRFHGDSETLRETLYAARQRGIVAINNPSFKTVEMKLDEEGARDYLSGLPLPKDFLSEEVEALFGGERQSRGKEYG